MPSMRKFMYYRLQQVSMQPVWAAAGNLSQLVTDRLSEELDYDEITTIKLCSVIPPPWIFFTFLKLSPSFYNCQ